MTIKSKLKIKGIKNMNILRLAFLGFGIFIESAPMYAAKGEPLTAQDICRRLQITEEILVFDSTGEKIINIDTKMRLAKGSAADSQKVDPKRPDVVCTKASASGQTSSDFEGSLFFAHSWYVKKDGKISVEYEQGTNFKGRGRDSDIVGSTGKESVELKDFQPISWVSKLHKNQRVIVRLVPSLAESAAVKELSKFPIILDNAAVFDGKGRLWTASFTAEGEYIAATTIHGGVMMSYQPFTGGKKVGRASGHELKFKLEDGTSVVLKSDSLILPGDMTADVYVMVDPSLKAESISSQSVSTGSNAEEILAKLKNVK